MLSSHKLWILLMLGWAKKWKQFLINVSLMRMSIKLATYFYRRKAKELRLSMILTWSGLRHLQPPCLLSPNGPLLVKRQIVAMMKCNTSVNFVFRWTIISLSLIFLENTIYHWEKFTLSGEDSVLQGPEAGRTILHLIKYIWSFF